MTNEQILELANQHLRYFEDGWRGTEWSGKPEELLKFAQAIYQEGYNQSYDDSKSSSFKGFHNCLDD